MNFRDIDAVDRRGRMYFEAVEVREMGRRLFLAVLDMNLKNEVVSECKMLLILFGRTHLEANITVLKLSF